MRGRCALFCVATLIAVGCNEVPEDQRVSEEERKARDEVREDNVVQKKFTKEILDWKVVEEEHPDWVEIDPELSGSDPLTTSMTGYKQATADIAKMTFQNWMQQKQILEDRVPTYAEAKQYVEKESAGLPARRFYEHYVYDETTGELKIMRDEEEYRAELKRRGISPE